MAMTLLEECSAYLKAAGGSLEKAALAELPSRLTEIIRNTEALKRSAETELARVEEPDDWP